MNAYKKILINSLYTTKIYNQVQARERVEKGDFKIVDLVVLELFEFNVNFPENSQRSYSYIVLIQPAKYKTYNMRLFILDF